VKDFSTGAAFDFFLSVSPSKSYSSSSSSFSYQSLSQSRYHWASLAMSLKDLIPWLCWLYLAWSFLLHISRSSAICCVMVRVCDLSGPVHSSLSLSFEFDRPSGPSHMLMDEVTSLNHTLVDPEGVHGSSFFDDIFLFFKTSLLILPQFVRAFHALFLGDFWLFISIEDFAPKPTLLSNASNALKSSSSSSPVPLSFVIAQLVSLNTSGVYTYCSLSFSLLLL